jgi:hypothetical protein
VPRRFRHSIDRLGLSAAVLLLLIQTSGCALWNADRWNLDRYRDQQAVDIEQNLSRKKPIVANPF